jgi:hypothetical protein
MCEHVSQIGFGIDVVEFCGADERVDCGSTFTACVRACEQIVLAPEYNGTQGTLGGVVIDLDAAIVAVARERSPASEFS